MIALILAEKYKQMLLATVSMQTIRWLSSNFRKLTVAFADTMPNSNDENLKIVLYFQNISSAVGYHLKLNQQVHYKFFKTTVRAPADEISQADVHESPRNKLH